MVTLSENAFGPEVRMRVSKTRKQGAKLKKMLFLQEVRDYEVCKSLTR
jgi:hypothetical protein